MNRIRFFSILLRYANLLMILIFFLLGLSAQAYPQLIFFLLWVVNLQVRFFSSADSDLFFFLSIVADLVFITLCFATMEQKAFLFLIPIMDTLFLMRHPIRYLIALFPFFWFFSLAVSMDSLQFVRESIYALLIAALCGIALYHRNRNRSLSKELTQKESQIEELEQQMGELEKYIGSAETLATIQERNRLSREIHDSVGHSLSTIIIQLGALEKLSKSDPTIHSMLHELGDFTKTSLEEIRLALRALKPIEYSENMMLLRIREMADTFSKMTQIKVIFSFSGTPFPFDEEVSHLLYRAVQEFLSNSSRHGSATVVKIHGHFEERLLILTMKDNGKGTDTIDRGIGLTSLEERLSAVGGSVSIRSKSGQGFSVRLSIEKKKEVSYENNDCR